MPQEISSVAAQVKEYIRAFDSDDTGFISREQLTQLMVSIDPSWTSRDLQNLFDGMGAGKNGIVRYNDFVDFVCFLENGKEDKPVAASDQFATVVAENAQLRKELAESRRQLGTLRRLQKRQPFDFRVGQYNILAGYMGNNTEPWFLYGIEMNEEKRKRVFESHGKRLPDGKPANPGWENYSRGVLTPEEIANVELINREHFAWEKRKDKLLKVIEDMDSDLLSLVECDYYEDHFKPALAAMGYESVWKKRPRPASKDGCCIAWRPDIFEFIDQHSVEYVDKYDPVAKRTFKDRIALMTLLRITLTGTVIVFVSTHLQRNPEDPTQDMLRARQVGQVVREMAECVAKHNCKDAPVILTGDLNCTSFGRLRGIANTVSLLNRCTYIHPFTFDAGDVPTGVTSVTTARCMRIDALMYQSQRLELMDVDDVPDLTPANPIPNEEHPSDHVPIVAQFRVRSSMHMMQQAAKEWFYTVAGCMPSVPLSGEQLRNAFKLYDFDGAGHSTQAELRKCIQTVVGPSENEVNRALQKLPSDGVDFVGFVKAYNDAIAIAGIPGLEDFKDAFAALDKDGSGTLDMDEFLSVFKDCAPAAVPEEDLKALFKAIDTSGDGHIDLEEMIVHLSKVWVETYTGLNPPNSARPP